jgi:hypothetical protein
MSVMHSDCRIALVYGSLQVEMPLMPHGLDQFIN